MKCAKYRVKIEGVETYDSFNNFGHNARRGIYGECDRFVIRHTNISRKQTNTQIKNHNKRCKIVLKMFHTGMRFVIFKLLL